MTIFEEYDGVCVKYKQEYGSVVVLFESKLLGCGAALIDLRTGRSHVMEAWSVDGSDVMEEIGSRIACFDVCEVLLLGDEDAFDGWSGRLELMGVHRNMLHRSVANFCNPGYQDQVLLKAFKSVGFLTPAEFVGLERHPLALTAYVAVLDFAHKHDESLIYNLPVPTVLVSTSAATHVRLSSSTLRNLNLTQARDDASGELCLSRLLDHCVTYPGKRLFRERLLQPITDTIELNRRYDATEAMRQDHAAVHRGLRGVCDVDRAWRKISMQSGSLRDVPGIRDSLLRLRQLRVALPDTVTAVVGHEVLDDVSAVLEELQGVTDEGTLAEGLYADVDHARAELDSYNDVKTTWVQGIRRLLVGTKACEEWVRLGSTDDPCAHAVCTPKRFEIIKPLLPEGIIVLDVSKTAVKFTQVFVRNAARESLVARAHLVELSELRTKELQQVLAERASHLVARLSHAMSLLDLHAAIAQDVAGHRLVRPTLEEAAPRAFLRCSGLRHPLVERVSQATEYVVNDVRLDDDTSGMLLFGINAAGKSTLCKAVALAVFMAQAGLYVACDAMSLAPFSSIYTRMATTDDIYHGRSTFMVELAELRDILHHADARSLVVGDELCSGTESASAISIVGSACLALDRKRSHFMFATHLHELPDVKAIRASTRITIAHLSVRYDDAADMLVYNRRLMDGPGNALYGLEVARAMRMERGFMQDAHAIRRELLGVQEDVVNQKKSNYNRNIYMDLCGACGERKAEETHHIEPQRLADSNGMIGRFHKNAAHNLIPLCAQCHDDVHSKGLHIPSAVMTTRGILRV
ncbi:putative DNA mismatch repair protein mutS L359 [Tetrabaena socialis]|uniref:Putative DNA mismatch repair protein mutS L359 n=1 Tax=Tetrabaena socialis TaxID=47790 RepID=A0A2J7ZLU9_9CHLO|nr:putative DNA mismatch repair protein mutS L359 [Tetrabaena socialis]|eukprot:PNH01241.1 putative DNA mismatch repair protein mutS L359 [Tetrabaena socialis]